jgi:dienelactone hydrolase
MEAIGFSGGSGTIIGTIAHCYGNIQPSVYDHNYTPDEIDAENADFDGVCAMYGPNAEFSSDYTGLETENEHLPEIFIAAGQLDYANAGLDSLILAQSIFDRTKVELHLFADTRHGFSLGLGNNNSAYWVPMADAFFDRIGN